MFKVTRKVYIKTRAGKKIDRFTDFINNISNTTSFGNGKLTRCSDGIILEKGRYPRGNGFNSKYEDKKRNSIIFDADDYKELLYSGSHPRETEPYLLNLKTKKIKKLDITHDCKISGFINDKSISDMITKSILRQYEFVKTRNLKSNFPITRNVSKNKIKITRVIDGMKIIIKTKKRPGEQLKFLPNGYIKIIGKNNIRIFNKKGQEIDVPRQIKEKIEEIIDEQKFIVKAENGLYGVVDINNQTIISEKYNKLEYLGDGLFLSENEENIQNIINFEEETAFYICGTEEKCYTPEEAAEFSAYRVTPCGIDFISGNVFCDIIIRTSGCRLFSSEVNKVTVPITDGNLEKADEKFDIICMEVEKVNGDFGKKLEEFDENTKSKGDEIQMDAIKLIKSINN